MNNIFSNKFHSDKHKYRPDIDGIRALAVLSVVIFHFFPHRLPAGFLGVDVFFVISGYLITYLILEDIDQKKFSLITFYKRRVRRIFPALIVTFTLVIAVGYLTLLAHEYQQLGKHILGGVFFVPNFLLLNESGYFDATSYTKPLLHLWSLGIEEQFYLFWPLMLWWLGKSRSSQLIFILSVILISFLLWISFNTFDATAAFYLPITRVWELAVGGMLAYYNLYFDDTKTININAGQSILNNKISLEIFALLGIFMISISVAKFSQDTAYYSYLVFMPVLGTVLLIYSGTSTLINKYFLSSRPMVWFGLISYPLYLVHWPIYSFTYILENGVPDKGIRVISIIISIVISWIIFNYIERFVRFGKNKFRKYSVTGLFLMMVTVSLSGLYIFIYEGLPDRFKTKDELHYILKNPEPEVTGYSCNELIPSLLEFDRQENCILNKKQLPEIAFIGDSHLRMYRKPIFDSFSDKPIMMVMRPTCLPFVYPNPRLRKVNDECLSNIETLNRYLSEDNSVNTLIFTGFWAYLMAGDFLEADTGVRKPQKLTEEAKAVFLEKAGDFINSAHTGKKRLILIQDIPHLDFPILSCLKVRPIELTQKNRRTDCSVNQSDFQIYIQPYDEVIDLIISKYPMVEFYDPRPLFCNESKCMAKQGGFPLYRNGDHLNFVGGNMVIDDLLKKFPELIQPIGEWRPRQESNL